MGNCDFSLPALPTNNKTPGRACYSTRCFVVCPNNVPIKNRVFGLSFNGGAEGSRTPVRKHFNRTFSERSRVSTFPRRADTRRTARFSRVMMRGRGNSYPPHGRHINDALPGLWPLRFGRLPLVRQRQQVYCCQFIFKLPVLWRSGAAARLSCLCTPVETGAAPNMNKSTGGEGGGPPRSGVYRWNGSASFSGSGYVSPWVSTVMEAMT